MLRMVMDAARSRTRRSSLAVPVRVGVGDALGDNFALLDVLGWPGFGGEGTLVQHAGARSARDDVAAATP